MKEYNFKEIDKPINGSSSEIAKVIIERIGLGPKKSNSTKKMHKVLIELYERKKLANKNKRAYEAIMSVDEMAYFADISRQTMYDYLPRWLNLNIIVKENVVIDGKRKSGYRLNGNTLKEAFEKSEYVVKNFLSKTKSIIEDLQSEIKREKIKRAKK
ncbi:MAG: hypothetical protein ACOCRX_02045 [Candidatus Woesearchaeota archaeon]